MIARNLFQLPSEPTDIILNLTAIRDNYTFPEAMPKGSSGVPIYGVVLIAMVAAIVLALIVVAIVAVLCILHSRYEQSKYYNVSQY